MPNIRNVQNTDGDDISDLVNEAAAGAGLDAVALLALLRAESGLNPRAERWGSRTEQAQAAIAAQNLAALAGIINQTWPDISFGMSQRIVLFHEIGDRTGSVVNCLAVRDAVFNDPKGDIAAAARRLAGCFGQSLDGSALGALAAYNGGVDRRNDPEWMRVWGRNIAAYEAALREAERYAVPALTPEQEWANVYDVLNGISGQLASFSQQLADVLAITKRLRGE